MGALAELLISRPRRTLHAAADAAVLAGLLEPMHALGRDRFACLLPGHVDADLAHVAPYLIALHPGSPIVDWIDARCELPWGYVIESELALNVLQRHLRRFAETRGPRGEEWWFRFWDPRVLRCLPDILHPAQAEGFMHGIERIHLVDGGSTASLAWNAREGRMAFESSHAAVEGAVAHAGI
jgi:hypothetical protein